MDNNKTANFGKQERTILLASLYVQVFVGTFANIIVLITFIFRRQLRKRSSDLLIFNLALVELFCCAIYLPWKIYNMDQKVSGTRHYMFLIFSFCLMSSLNTISAIAFDKFVAVMFPLQYVIRMTVKRTKYLIASCWIIAAIPSIIYGFFHLFQIKHDFYTMFLSVSYVLQLSVTSIFYVIIFKMARNHALDIKRNSPQNIDGRSNHRLAMKSVWNTLFVVFIFHVTVLPYIVFRFTGTTAENWMRLSCFTFICSCVNPGIYFFLRRRYRYALCSILKRQQLRESQMVY